MTASVPGAASAGPVTRRSTSAVTTDMQAAAGAASPVPHDALLWVNGRRVDPASPAHVSAFDRGFTLADGLFETMRAYHGTLFRLDPHLARLAHGARVLGIPVPSSLPDQIDAAMHDVRQAGFRDAAVRLTVSRGTGPRGLAPPPNVHPTVVLAVQRLPATPASPVAATLTVRTARARRNEHALTAGLKTLACLESILALSEAQAAGADEALFLDTDGHLSEATASNLFLITGEILLTPPTGCGILPGVTRAAILELAPTVGLAAREQILVPDDLHAADAAFLTSSLREIAPIAAIDDHPLADDGRGPSSVTRRLAVAFSALVQRECAP